MILGYWASHMSVVPFSFEKLNGRVNKKSLF